MSTQSLFFFLLKLYVLIVSNSTARKRFDPKRAISIINGYRKLHLGEGHSLKPDEKLQEKAKKAVKQAALNGGFPSEVSAGENVFQVCASFGVSITPKQVIKAWYDEVCGEDVDFEEGIFDNAESFSQLVWKDSYYVGIASNNGKKDNQTCKFISAFFRPPGNIAGFYQENVKVGDLKWKEYCDEL